MITPSTLDPFAELDRLAAGFFRGRLTPMPVDLYRDGDNYVLSADLPGVDPGSIDVSVENQTLTIRAERTLSNAEGSEWLSRERRSASYFRQLAFGSALNMEDITASYDNGVLSVIIPVSSKAAPRKIAVEQRGGQPLTLDREDKSEVEAKESVESGTTTG